MALKIAKGDSIKVTVPAGKNVEAGKFVLINGFLGLALQSGAEGKEIVLDISKGIYQTSQIKATDTFSVGTKIYWDNTEVFTTTATDNKFAGIVTAGKDSNGVIEFYFVPELALLSEIISSTQIP